MPVVIKLFNLFFTGEAGCSVKLYYIVILLVSEQIDINKFSVALETDP